MKLDLRRFEMRSLGFLLACCMVYALFGFYFGRWFESRHIKATLQEQVETMAACRSMLGPNKNAHSSKFYDL